MINQNNKGTNRLPTADRLGSLTRAIPGTLNLQLLHL